MAIVDIISTFLSIYILCVFVWALMSFLPMISPGLAFNSTVIAVRNFLDSIVLPYVRLFSFIKPVQIGGAMVDLSATVAIIVLIVVQNFVLPQVLGA